MNYSPHQLTADHPLISAQMPALMELMRLSFQLLLVWNTSQAAGTFTWTSSTAAKTCWHCDAHTSRTLPA